MFLSLRLPVKTSLSMNDCGLQMLANAAAFLAYSFSSKRHERTTFLYNLHCIEVDWDTLERRYSCVSLRS